MDIDLAALPDDVETLQKLVRSLAARDRNNPISANKIRLKASLMNQEHHPIRLRLLAGLSFRQRQHAGDVNVLVLPMQTGR